MKTSLAASLSIIGVLATGGMALAANTTVLSPTLSPVQGLAPAVSVDSTVQLSTTVPAMAQSSYNVPGVGTITLGQDASTISVLSVDPTTGWTYTATNEQTGRIEIEFSTDTKMVKFNAALVDGRIVTEVQATDTSATLAGKDDDEADDQSDDEADDQSDDGQDSNEDSNS